MDSSDEIVVAAPRRHSSGFSTGSIATASDSVAGGWKADLDTVSATNTSTEAVAAAAARVVDLTGSSSRASSPLSDVDEDVLQEAPTAILRQLASDEGLLSSPSSASKSSLDPLSFNSSAPQPSSSDRSTRKRARATDTMSASDEPPAKRRRGRPAQSAAPQTFAPPNRTSGGIVDELGLDDVNDDLDVRPTRGRVLSNGGGSIANRLGRRSTARSMLDGDADGMGKPRRRAADRLAVNEKYEPLHLYEESNWVLFDPVKDFPSTLPSPPKFLGRFTHYKPGNVKILEYNLVSNSIRLKGTPKALRGKSVSYGGNGPRLE